MQLSGVAAHQTMTVLRPPTGTSATSLFSVPQPPGATKGAVAPAGGSANMQSMLLQLQGGSAPQASAPRAPDPHAPAASTVASNATSGAAASGGDLGTWVGHALKAYGPAIGTAVGGPVGGLIGVAVSALL